MKYMYLLLLKLRVLELESRTEPWNVKAELKVDFWLQIGIADYRSDVFNVIFEINRDLFLVFLLLTLNIVFLVKYVVSKVT